MSKKKACTLALALGIPYFFALASLLAMTQWADSRLYALSCSLLPRQ